MKATFSKAEFESELASRFGIALKPRERSEAQVLATGIAEVDALTGGLPRGAITEIFGVASSGRMTLVLSALAETTTREVCALVDTNDSFHPATAASAGVVFEQLLWMRCGAKLESAFKATDLLLQGGGFGLVILDLGDVPSQDVRRIISSWWYRFRRVVENTPTALVVISPDSCVRSCASLTLEMKRNSESWCTTANISSASPYDSELIKRKFLAPVISLSATTPTGNSLHPTHSTLLTSMKVAIEQQRPVHFGNPSISFIATPP